MNICPCCGAKRNNKIGEEACAACGAQSVGPPLARPEKELPSYLSALAIGLGSAFIGLVFLVNTAFALFEQEHFSFNFGTILAAGETAAWRLKWLALPLSLLVVWAGARVSARIVREPARFMGRRLANAGLTFSVVMAVGLTVLIGLTIPARLQQRENSVQAGLDVQACEASKVLYEYRLRYNSYPATAKDLLNLPDPDGSVARLAAVMGFENYEPQSAIAALPPPSAKTRSPRGASVPLRPVALRTDIGEDVAGEAISFTNYKLRLPGRDKKLGTEDDMMIRDGLIVPAPPLPLQPSRTSATNLNRMP